MYRDSVALIKGDMGCPKMKAGCYAPSPCSDNRGVLVRLKFVSKMEFAVERKL